MIKIIISVDSNKSYRFIIFNGTSPIYYANLKEGDRLQEDEVEAVKLLFNALKKMPNVSAKRLHELYPSLSAYALFVFWPVGLTWSVRTNSGHFNSFCSYIESDEPTSTESFDCVDSFQERII